MSQTNPWQEDIERVARFYSDRVEQHGLAPESLDWGSRQSQERRFAILEEIGPLAGRSLLDVGCGLADLWDYLHRQGVEVDYTGYDVTPSMIDRAQSRFPSLKLLAMDLFSPARPKGHFDYVVESGLFTFYNEDLLKTAVEIMFSMCEIAVGFNSLSSWAPDQQTGEFYADPLATLAFCKTITPWVTLRHDYMPHDFTIFMYREANQT